MANSTAVIHDLGTLAGTDFTSASIAKAYAARFNLDTSAGEAMINAKMLKSTLASMLLNLDSGDPAVTLVTNILGTLT